MSITNGDILDPGLKFIQLKNYQLTDENANGGGQCLTIDQNRQTIFACCQNTLVFVPIPSLLNFDVWSKSLLDTVDNQLINKVTIIVGGDSVNCHLLSISSRGYGSKLALCCYDSVKTSLSILFFDIKSAYQNREKTLPYSQFNIPINTDAGEVKVRQLIWHPEVNDNIFGCCLTDGSFYVVYISESDRNLLTVLTQYHTKRHITSFAWSPKGKQIVVGFRDTSISNFSQFKLPINEKDLVQNTPFDEVKKISLPGDFKAYHVCNICWLSTFTFMMICSNAEENDTHYMVVSIPSAKATGSDAVIKVIDYSCLNIDSTYDLPIQADFLHAENVIFTYTNRSSAFALLGCQTANDIGTHNRWCEISLEDVSSLWLPTIKSVQCDANFISIRGLALSPGTAKQFQFSPSVTKGGLERHYAITYNQFGYITLFMVDFDEHTAPGGLFFKIPSAPATVIRPTISPLAQNLSTFSRPSIAPAPASNQPNINLASTTNLFNQANKIPVSTVASAATTPKTTPLATISKTPAVSISFPTPSSNITTPVSVAVPVSKPSVISSQLKEGDTNIEQLYVDEIRSNIKEFNAEIKANLAAQRSILSSVSIGTAEQFDKVKNQFDFINGMLSKLFDQYNSFNVDVNDLQTAFIELHYLCEETRSLLDRNTDPKYRSLLRQRTLDPITSRKVKEIYSLRDYIDVQLRELNTKFDLEWQEWLQKKRRSGGGDGGSLSESRSFGFMSPRGGRNSHLVRTPPTTPHSSFIADSPRSTSSFTKKTDSSNGAQFEDDLNEFPSKAIYKALDNNQRLIDSLRIQLKELRCSISKYDPHSAHRNIKLETRQPANVNMNNLTALFNESLTLNNHMSSLSVASMKKTSIVIQSLPPKRKIALKNFLQNRAAVPIRVCGPCGGDDRFAGKSRFVSVLEKIKQKECKSATSLTDLLVEPHKEERKNEIERKHTPSASTSIVSLPTSSAISSSKLNSSKITANGQLTAITTVSNISKALPKSGLANNIPINTQASTSSAVAPGLPAINGTVTGMKPVITQLPSDVLKISSKSNSTKEGSFGLPSSLQSSSKLPVELPKTMKNFFGSSTTDSSSSSPFTSFSFGSSDSNPTASISSAATTSSASSGLTSCSNPIFSASLFATNDSGKKSSLPTTNAVKNQPGLSTSSTTISNSESANNGVPTFTFKLPPTSSSSFSFNLSSKNLPDKPAAANVSSTTTAAAIATSSPFASFSFAKKTSSATVVSTITSTPSLFTAPATKTSETKNESTSTAGAPINRAATTLSLVNNNSESITTSVATSISTSSAASSDAPIAYSTKPFTSSFSFGQIATSTSTANSDTSKPTSLSSFSFNQASATLEKKPETSFSFFPKSAANTVTTSTTTAEICSTSVTTVASSSPVTITKTVSPTTEATNAKSASSASFSFNQSLASSSSSSSSQPKSALQALLTDNNSKSESSKSSSIFTQSAFTDVKSPFASASTSSVSIENTLSSFQICSPSGAGTQSVPAVSTAVTTSNVFGSGFSFGGTNTASSLFGSNASGNDFTFASPILKPTWTTNSLQPPALQVNNAESTLIGNASNQSLFGMSTAKPSAFQPVTSPTTAANVSAFGSPAKFGSNAMFGQMPGMGSPSTLFGGPPSFGSPSSTFGASATFASSPAMGFGVGGAGGQTPFSNFNSNETFGSFALKDADVPSFGSFAADATSGGQQQPPQQSFGGFNSPSFGQDTSFTQRRK